VVAELGQTDGVADRESVWCDGYGGGGEECEHGDLLTIVHMRRTGHPSEGVTAHPRSAVDVVVLPQDLQVETAKAS
jgi:hypothetical protein